MENICAISQDREGGAKRTSWRKPLILLLANDEENNALAGSKMFGSLAPNRTRTGFSNATDKEIPKGPGQDFRADSVLNSINYSTSNYPPKSKNHARIRLRAMSDLSLDIDMSPDGEFATSLCDFLGAEVWRQEQRENWRHGVRIRERRWRHGPCVDSRTLQEPVEVYLAASSKDINL